MSASACALLCVCHNVCLLGGRDPHHTLTHRMPYVSSTFNLKGSEANGQGGL